MGDCARGGVLVGGALPLAGTPTTEVGAGCVVPLFPTRPASGAWLQVRPELFMGTFRCMECNTVVADVEQQFKYTKPVLCPNTTCGNK